MYGGHANGVDSDHFEHAQLCHSLEVRSAETRVYPLLDNVVDFQLFGYLET